MSENKKKSARPQREKQPYKAAERGKAAFDNYSDPIKVAREAKKAALQLAKNDKHGGEKNPAAKKKSAARDDEDDGGGKMPASVGLQQSVSPMSTIHNNSEGFSGVPRILGMEIVCKDEEAEARGVARKQCSRSEFHSSDISYHAPLKCGEPMVDSEGSQITFESGHTIPLEVSFFALRHFFIHTWRYIWGLVHTSRYD